MFHSDIVIRMVCSIEDADPSKFVQSMTLAYFTSKSDNLNILDSFDTQMS